jgi:DNA-binding PadR family transcriptional regulator
MGKKVLAKDLLKKTKIQENLLFWQKHPDKWIQSNEIRNKLVNGPKLIIKSDGTYIEAETHKPYKTRPKTLYDFDSQLYHDMKDMVTAGLLDNKKEIQKKGKPKSYYRLSKKHKFEPLKIFYNNILFDCSESAIHPSKNLTLFFPRLDELNPYEKKKLYHLMLEQNYDSISEYLKKVGLRIASEVWSKALKNNKSSKELKFYFWMKLILIHYLATISFDEIHHCFRLGENPHVDMDRIHNIKINEFTPPFNIGKFKIRFLPERQKELFNLFDKAFWKYLDELHIFVDKKKFNQQVNFSEVIFNRIIEKTLIKRAEAEFFICIIHPEHLSYFSLIEIGGEDTESALDIVDSYIYRDDHKKLKSIKKETVKKSFFEVSVFFDGLEDDINKLFERGIEDLNYQFRELVQTFKYPKIKKPN